MKRETNIRIEDYRRRLPRLKEKLSAAVVLLLVGAVLMTTVSFAWLALSTSPEVSNITTSITSNGNLEIALATGSRNALAIPGASAIGDSGNYTTWGNLINLSDATYGLNNVTLRPARLNKTSLISEPLQIGIYDTDGRLNTEGTSVISCLYAKWQEANDDDPGKFVFSDDIGVRALVSMTSGVSDELSKKKALVENAYNAIGSNYDSLLKDQDNIDALAYVMGTYMGVFVSDTADYTNPTLYSATDSSQKHNLDLFYTMMKSFDETVLRQELITMCRIVNLNIYVYNITNNANISEYELGNFANINDVKDEEKQAKVDAALAKFVNDYGANKLSQYLTLGVDNSQKSVLTGKLSELIKDRENLQNNYNALNKIINEEYVSELKWQDSIVYNGVTYNMPTIVDKLVNVRSCTLGGTRVDAILSQMRAYLNDMNVQSALALIANGQDAVITSGALKQFEARTGCRMNVQNMSVTAKFDMSGKMGTVAGILGNKMTITIATVTTDASTNTLEAYKTAAVTYSDNAQGQSSGNVDISNMIAGDTYGFAIDFWVRTNAGGSFLTLEGNVLTETTYEDVTVTIDGKTYDVYTGTETITDSETGEASSYSVDLFLKDGKYCYVSDPNTEYDTKTKGTPKQKQNEIKTVIGYEGENRIWDGNAFLATDSTTQGNGSCYVFYYSSIEDRDRCLRVLSAMRVAFVDEDGNLMATGYMDTANCFEDNGKMTVPLALSSNATTVGETPVITALEQNVAKLVTAIVYLDGSEIGNEDVLATSDIQGQLNIQFGSTAALNAMTDEDLASKYLTVKDTTEKKKVTFKKDETASVTAKLKIEGDVDEKTKVYGVWVRSINTTQGVPLTKECKFGYNNGEWTAQYTFDSPGTYKLRSVRIGGVEYDLRDYSDDRELLTVVVEGYTVNVLTMGQNDFLTSENSVSTTVNMELLTDLPIDKLQGVFKRTNGDTVTVNFANTSAGDGSQWTGTVTFRSSGDYVLDHLNINNEPYDVPDGLKLKATVHLGLRASVWTGSAKEYKYEGENINVDMYLKIYDDTGTLMTASDLKDAVTLYYSIDGSNAPEKGVNAKMTWNTDGSCSGTFKIEAPCILRFSNITVGSNNTITQTIGETPIFTITSPNPPKFTGNATDEYQFADGSEAHKNVSFTINGEYFAGIKPEDLTVEFTVKGQKWSLGKDSCKVELKNEGSSYSWIITVPVSGSVGDDKNEVKWNWENQTVQLTGVTVPVPANGYDGVDGDTYTMDLSNENVKTNVVSSFNVAIADKQATTNGHFLTDVSLKDRTDIVPTITVTDAFRRTYLLTSVAYNYNYEVNSGTTVGAGRYSFSKDTFEFEITADGSSKVTSDTKILYAGIYNLSKITYTFAFDDGVTIEKSIETIDGEKNKMTHDWTTLPSVEITETGYYKTNYGATKQVNVKEIIVYTARSESKVGGINGRQYHYYQPYLTITLTLPQGTAAVQKAELVFSKNGEGEVLLYTKHHGSESCKVYSFANSNNSWSCKMWLGTLSDAKTAFTGWPTDQDYSLDKGTAAETIKATELVLTDSDGNEYTVATSITITHNNP